jgi:hypothetical protein
MGFHQDRRGGRAVGRFRKGQSGIAAATTAVTSALAGGMISPGEAATIAAELAMPDLDLIKQEEQVRCRAG